MLKFKFDLILERLKKTHYKYYPKVANLKIGLSLYIVYVYIPQIKLHVHN